MFTTRSGTLRAQAQGITACTMFKKTVPRFVRHESLYVTAFEGRAFGNLTFHVSRLTRNNLRMLADFFSILLAQV